MKLMEAEKKEVAKVQADEMPVNGVYGKVIAVRGPVADVRFEQVKDLPALYDVLIGQSFNKRKVVLEVAEHLSKNDVRCIALSETLNLQLNSKILNTKKPVSIRTGDELFGRIINVFGDPLIIVNMSVWESIEDLKNFAYKSAHVQVFRDRAQWFEKMEVAHMALWWVPVGAMPTAEEGRERLLYLRENGESEWAFTFRSLVNR
jgi:flagellar biosynthesis/type III secretory pathway ATPase